MSVKDDSIKFYTNHYADTLERLTAYALSFSKGKPLSESRVQSIENQSQKDAIMLATIDTLRANPDASSSDVWNAVYSAHLYRKSGISDPEMLEKALSASQSWKKSSGHAFEEMIKLLGTQSLHQNDIDIVLQRDLSRLISDNDISNEQRDIDWLKLQLAKDIFDLYAIVIKNDKRYVFGCIQTKSSIRDRVTRDREPSVHAMEHFFWSTIIVFDGSWLAMPKFRYMVNGGNDEFPHNGWHGMYVFSEDNISDRIYSTNLDMKNFKEHAIQAADYWLTQRQWFDGDWKAK